MDNRSAGRSKDQTHTKPAAPIESDKEQKRNLAYLVVLAGVSAGEMFKLGIGIMGRVVERIDLDDGREELLDEEADFFPVGGGGDEFAAGDGVVFVDERKDFPDDKRKEGAAIERVVAKDHAAEQDAENDAMRDRHRRNPADHRRPITEREQDDEEKIGLPC